MKNGIIVLLALTCIFFLLNALGVFQFGSIIDRDHRTWHENTRKKAVAKSPVLKLGTLYDDTDLPAMEAVEGMVFAVNKLNREGGVLGKQLELIKRNKVENLPLHNSAIQDFCDDFATAVVVGPLNSGYIPTARALTQFQGLPLISPLTVSSEKLPRLEPDNFVTFFPPLKLWVHAILDHMEKKEYKNLLIISPQTDTYGDIFCTAMERESRHRPKFDRIYRLNYQIPLRRKDLLRAIQNYCGENSSYVLFFGGTFSDFPEFIELLNELKIKLPVYGSDDLYIPQTRKMKLPSVLFLPRVVLRQKETPFIKEWKQRFKKEPSYHAILGAKTVLAIAEALKKNGGYNPEELVESLRKIQKDRLRDPEKTPVIEIDEFFGKNKTAL